MKFLYTAFLALLLVACASIRVNYDYDKQVNFNNYKTYQYYGDMATGFNELDTKRLLDAIDAQMAAKGFSISETPDFFIDIKSTEYRKPRRSSIGVGIGGTGRNVGGGLSVGIPVGQIYVNRQVIIDFVDENKKQLFWQAVSEFSFNLNATPEKREEIFQSVAKKVLAEYPPEQ